MTYDETRDVLWLLDQAVIKVAPGDRDRRRCRGRRAAPPATRGATSTCASIAA